MAQTSRLRSRLRKKRARSARLIVVAALALVSPACAINTDDDDDSAELPGVTTQVDAFDFYFRPTTVVLEPNVEATVNLLNNGAVLHSFTIEDLDVEVEAEGGQTAALTFVTPDVARAYEFVCKYHPDQMRGTVTIESGGEGPEDAEMEIEDDEDADTETEGNLDY